MKRTIYKCFSFVFFYEKDDLYVFCLLFFVLLGFFLEFSSFFCVLMTMMKIMKMMKMMKMTKLMKLMIMMRFRAHSK